MNIPFRWTTNESVLKVAEDTVLAERYYTLREEEVTSCFWKSGETWCLLLSGGVRFYSSLTTLLEEADRLSGDNEKNRNTLSTSC